LGELDEKPYHTKSSKEKPTRQGLIFLTIWQKNMFNGFRILAIDASHICKK
jgi:hypothetical protein